MGFSFIRSSDVTQDQDTALMRLVIADREAGLECRHRRIRTERGSDMYSFDDYCRDCGIEVLNSTLYGRVSMRAFDRMSDHQKAVLAARHKKETETASVASR